jgi:hypothetical protein
MNCNVIGLVALGEILRLFFSGVVCVAFEFDIGNDFLHVSDSTSLVIYFAQEHRLPFISVRNL